MGTQSEQVMAPTLTPVEYDLVYNMISLGLASMAASTIFFYLRLSSFAERYKTALCITGLVTFIAMYHYFRIFNSFTESYSPRAKRSAGAQKVKGSAQEVRAPWSWSRRMRHSPNPLIPRPREWACLIHDHGSHMKARAIMPRGRGRRPCRV